LTVRESIKADLHKPLCIIAEKSQDFVTNGGQVPLSGPAHGFPWQRVSRPWQAIPGVEQRLDASGWRLQITHPSLHSAQDGFLAPKAWMEATGMGSGLGASARAPVELTRQIRIVRKRIFRLQNACCEARLQRSFV
jgi:hypothetical protein